MSEKSEKTEVDFNLGQVLDRLTILARKIVERPDYTHFFDEANGIVVATLPGRVFTPAALALILRLAAVNAALWEIEANTRWWREKLAHHVNMERSIWNAILEPDRRMLLDRLFRVQELNDLRAAIVQELNSIYGAGAVQEKV